jgi:hypothetical protein
MEINKLSENEKSVISLRLEQYDDIFSDFDIRQYSERALSVDFLSEIKRASVDKGNGGIELILNLPADQRNESTEGPIKERLNKHFNKHFQILTGEKRRVLRFGLWMIFLGIICMITVAFIVPIKSQNFTISFLLLFLDPVAIFLLWEGLDQIIFNSKNINPELDFYKKMSNSEGNIQFNSY